MIPQAFYGAAYPRLCAAERQLVELIGRCPIARDSGEGEAAVLYCKSRIKAPESMMRKLEKNGLPPTGRAALEHMHDAVGVRAVCAFTDDVYRVASWLSGRPEIRVKTVKDYIATPKPNGYRSLHLILEVPIFLSERTQPVRIELQLRTIAMDFWASLEHQLRYKSDVKVPPQISDDLKACADVIAATDEEMQRIAKELHVL